MGSGAKRKVPPINHGSVTGYHAETMHGVPHCEDCKFAYSDDRIGNRVRRHGQVGVNMPVEVLGRLLKNADIHTRQYLRAVLGPKTVRACIERAQRQEVTDG